LDVVSGMNIALEAIRAFQSALEVDICVKTMNILEANTRFVDQ